VCSKDVSQLKPQFDFRHPEMQGGLTFAIVARPPLALDVVGAHLVLGGDWLSALGRICVLDLCIVVAAELLLVVVGLLLVVVLGLLRSWFRGQGKPAHRRVQGGEGPGGGAFIMAAWEMARGC
jgi:hypothetical protein